MKLLMSILAFCLLQDECKIKPIPDDLRKLSVIPFFEPDEILRVWRFPEGGAIFEEMIEFVRYEGQWEIYRYQYLIDELTNDKLYQKYRKKEKLAIDDFIYEIPKFVNHRLLYRDVNNDLIERCLCDFYRAEYRLGNQGNIFKFDLEETHNTNISKIRLVDVLKKVFEDN